MSTRAFVTLIDEKKDIMMAAFCPSSAYPSHLGIQVLDALLKDEFPSIIKQLQEDYPDELETVDDIQRSWYVKEKGAENDYFHAYGYEYDPSHQKLNVYHYGDKVLSIPCSELSLYRKIFEMDDDLYVPLTFDPYSCTLKKDYYKELCSMLRDGAGEEDLRALCEKGKSILYIDLGRIVDGWNDSNFHKRIYDNGSNFSLDICVEERYHSYSLSVQTPFYRGSIATPPLRSAAAAEKEIAKLIEKQPGDIRGTMRLFREVEQYKRNMVEVFSNDDMSLEEREKEGGALRDAMFSAYEEAKKNCKILGDLDGLLGRDIKDVFSREVRFANQRLNETKKPSLDGVIESANGRSADLATRDSFTMSKER